MMKRLLITFVLLLCMVSVTFATDTGSCIVKKFMDYTVYVFEWETDDGTFDKPSTQATGLSPVICGFITQVRVDPGSAEQPDSSYSVYLYHKDYNIDYFIASGVGMDGTARTGTANIFTPLNSNDSWVYLDCVQVGLSVTGPGAGTNNGTVYVTVRNFLPVNTR